MADDSLENEAFGGRFYQRSTFVEDQTIVENN